MPTGDILIWKNGMTYLQYVCKTVVAHDSERGTLSTYYKIRCDNLVNKEYNKSKAKKKYTQRNNTLDNVQVG